MQRRCLFFLELLVLRITQAWGGEGWGDRIGRGTCSSGSSLLGILGAPDSGGGELCDHTGIDDNNTYHLLSALQMPETDKVLYLRHRMQTI